MTDPAGTLRALQHENGPAGIPFPPFHAARPSELLCVAATGGNPPYLSASGAIGPEINPLPIPRPGRATFIEARLHQDALVTAVTVDPQDRRPSVDPSTEN